MILYKYTDIKTAMLILMNKKFRYTQPIAFNDPFEVSPIAKRKIEAPFIRDNVDYIVSSNSLMTIAYEKTIRNLYNNLNSNEKKETTFNQFKEMIIEGIKDETIRQNKPLGEIIFEKIKFNITDFTSKFFNDLPRAIGSSTGVLCLSKCPDDILMWSHYADSHFGLVLEIDTDNKYFTNLKEVTYDMKRPSIDVNRDPIDENEILQLGKDIFFTKSTSWIYEKEYRDIKKFEFGENTKISDSLGYPIVLFEFPICIIKGIIFGSRISKKEKEKYTYDIRNYDYNIEFKEASLDKTSFKINIDSFNNNYV